MNHARIKTAAAAAGLSLVGALHPDAGAAQPVAGGTLFLLGAGPAFWPAYGASPEAHDGAPDPVDRWSARVIGALARDLGARAIFPFTGPPYAPFIDWALRSGRAHQSPTGILVHDDMGLLISYRGALHLSEKITLPTASGGHPCKTCPGQPCSIACPVGALSTGGPYDVAACHAYLDTGPGQGCMTMGCAVRRACPLSHGARRTPEQSALHMKAFHPT